MLSSTKTSDARIRKAERKQKALAKINHRIAQLKLLEAVVLDLNFERFKRKMELVLNELLSNTTD